MALTSHRLQADKIGFWKGNRVMAITDGAGPQVTVQGKEIHLVSSEQDDHAAAVVLAKRVVEKGPECHPHWIDLNKGGTVYILCNLRPVLDQQSKN